MLVETILDNQRLSLLYLLIRKIGWFLKHLIDSCFIKVRLQLQIYNVKCCHQKDLYFIIYLCYISDMVYSIYIKSYYRIYFKNNNEPKLPVDGQIIIEVTNLRTFFYTRFDVLITFRQILLNLPGCKHQA